MGFDLGQLLKDVPKLDTVREQIEYIRLDLIDEDPNNFYKLSDMDNLAANIQLCGLQQPIRVRPVSETGRYMIVSGHRRRKALEMLAAEDPQHWTEVPCIIEADEVSPALQQLRLIYANANTRTMTSAEVSEQAVQVEKLLYQLKEEGYEFPGRMRDHVAQAVGASKSKLARLKVIRDNLSFSWKQSWKDGKLSESTAYELAQLKPYHQDLIYSATSNPGMLYAGTVREYGTRFQAIDEVGCGPKKDTICIHKSVMMEKSCKDRWQDPCRTRCCMTCPSLVSCKSSCVKANSLKTQKKLEAKAASQAQKDLQAAKDAPVIAKISDLWQRFGLAREMAFKEIDDCKKAMNIYQFPFDAQKTMQLECGEAKITPDTKLPFGYSCSLSEVSRIIALADLFGCSIDWLLCRTDVKELTLETVPELGTRWSSGTPQAYGTYAAYVQLPNSKRMLRELLWTGDEWLMFGEKISDDVKVCNWIELPEA